MFLFLFKILGISTGMFEPNDTVPHYRIVSPTTLKCTIDTVFAELKENLLRQLENVDYVTTTADIWSTKHRSYLGMTVHWVDKTTLEMKSFPLCCRRFYSPHDNVRIAEIISSIHEEFGIEYKVIGTVTDNAANFAKSFKEFGISMEQFEEIHNACKTFEEFSDDMFSYPLELKDDEEDVVESNENVDIEDRLEIEFFEIPDNMLSAHYRCASHTLNLIATSDVGKITDLQYKATSQSAFAKVNVLCRKTNHPKSSETIKQILGKSLVVPCKTRWNSLYDTVSRILEFDIKLLNKVMVELEESKFTTIDYEFLKEYVHVMRPIARALDNLQSNCYFAYLLPTIHTMKAQLEEIQAENLVHCKPLMNQLDKAINRRFSKYFSLHEDVCKAAVVATCSHPHFKMRWLHKSFVANYSKQIQNIVIDAAINIAQQSVNSIKSQKIVEKSEYLSF